MPKTLLDLAKDIRDALNPDIPNDVLEESLKEKFGKEGFQKANQIIQESKVDLEVVKQQTEEKINGKIRD